jgi:hypothetical protein
MEREKKEKNYEFLFSPFFNKGLFEFNYFLTHAK